MTYNPNEPRWLTTASDVNLNHLTQQQAHMVLCLSGITSRNGGMKGLLAPRSPEQNTWTATQYLRDCYARADLVENARVWSRSQFTTDSACMLLCFVGVSWYTDCVSNVLQVRSACGFWWAATDSLVDKLYAAGYSFG